MDCAHDIVETKLNPLRSEGSIDAEALVLPGFATVNVVSGSAVFIVIGPATVPFLCASLNISL